jgi:hypothetical protein
MGLPQTGQMLHQYLQAQAMGLEQALALVLVLGLVLVQSLWLMNKYLRPSLCHKKCPRFELAKSLSFPTQHLLNYLKL